MSWRQAGERSACRCLWGWETCVATALPGKGMILLGAFGASVGFGIQQAMQMTDAQAVGFIGGEWRGIHGSTMADVLGHCGIQGFGWSRAPRKTTSDAAWRTGTMATTASSTCRRRIASSRARAGWSPPACCMPPARCVLSSAVGLRCIWHVPIADRRVSHAAGIVGQGRPERTYTSTSISSSNSLIGRRTSIPAFSSTTILNRSSTKSVPGRVMSTAGSTTAASTASS